MDQPDNDRDDAWAVERTLAGDRQSLKESIIGVEVFDRGPDFDPRIDSIVRVEARRLRRKRLAMRPWVIIAP